MRRLIESWVRAEQDYHGNTLAAAIRLMNETLGIRLNHSRVREWERGHYAPSQTTLSALLYRTLPWALKQAGIAVSEEQFHELEKLIWITGEEDGERFVELACSTKDETL